MLGKIRVAGSATGDDGWGPAYRAGRGLNASRYATDHREIFAAHAALSNRMVEDIAHPYACRCRHCAHQTRIKDGSNSIAKLTVPFLAAHAQLIERGGVVAIL
jgi:hypothetical protein